MTFFSHRDADLILKILVGIRAQEDRWIWKYEKKGFYSIKQGYKVHTDFLQTSPHMKNFLSWKKIWGLNVPTKLRNFIWRCM